MNPESPYTYPSKGKFNDPFLLNSNLYIPQDFYTALEFARYLAVKFPVYTAAATRTVSHFITGIEFTESAGDDRERSELNEYLVEQLQILEAMQEAGLEQFVYGNSFWRIHYPFDRYLIDRREGKYRLYSIHAFDGQNIKFNLESMTYTVPDPLSDRPVDQRPMVAFEFTDRKSHDASRIKLRNLDPVRMRINMNWVSGTCQYIWMFEEFFRVAVQKGDPIHQINETPIDMLRAIRNNQDFAFNPDTIFHFKEHFISGISNAGWGIPKIILNYNSVHQLQVLRCINEAVGLDYMLPFRLLSPSTGGAGMDNAAMSTHLGKWKQAVSQLIQNKRTGDGTSIHAIPFPISYQEFSGNGKQLAPVDLLKYQEDEMLNGMGIPANVYHLDLNMPQLPTGIRVFESIFTGLQRSMSNFLKWATRNILNYLEKEQIGVKLQLPSVANDLEDRHIWMQLAAGGQLSLGTAFRAFNIDNPIEEARRRAREDIAIQKIKQKEQSAFEREMTLGSASQVVDAMMQGQAGPGGVAPMPGPAAPGGGGNVTPLDLEQQGEEKAVEFLQVQDVGERRKLMAALSHSNPVLYAVAMRKMEEMRQQGASEGRKMVGKG